jgi:hypothetical protein
MGPVSVLAAHTMITQFGATHVALAPTSAASNPLQRFLSSVTLALAPLLPFPLCVWLLELPETK